MEKIMQDTITDTSLPEKEEVAPAASQEAQTEAEAPQSPEKKIQELEAQAVELKDQYLRKAAEFENFRKRMNREKQEAIEFANQNLLLDIIPIIDDFDRAIKSAEAATSPSPEFLSLREGIGMTEKRLITLLENKWGLKRYDSVGEVFDPNRHEAIMVEKSPDVSEPTVQEDFIKGYLLKDRLIRSAKVKVLMPETPDTEHAGEKDDTEQEE